MAFLRQTWALTKKNLLLTLVRHPWSLLLRAFILPIFIISFLAFARNLLEPPSNFGIGTPRPVRSVLEAMNAAGGGRNTLVFVNGGSAGGDIDRVIERVAEPVRSGGKTVKVLRRPEELLDACSSSLRAVSTCFAAAVFSSSPNEGPGGLWNYTLRADGSLGTRVNVGKATNDVELYTIPLQRAIDLAIASVNDTARSSALPRDVFEYPFTSRTEQQRRDDVRRSYLKGLVNFLAVAYTTAMVAVVYHLVGSAASERESGMSSLIDAMMPNVQRWQPQAARFLSYHLAFDMIYAPGWVVVGILLAGSVFTRTNGAIVVLYHLLAGLSFSSFSLFGAAFFRKAQLSSISVTIVAILLAILAQVVAKGSTATIAVLGLIFPPMNYVFFIILMARFERPGLATNLLKSPPENKSTLPGIALMVFLLVQLVVYPLLAALVERSWHAAASHSRKLAPQPDGASPVVIQNFSKQYQPSWFSRNVWRLFAKPADTVMAVDNLSLSVPRGQIMVLLGANGSGKSTTLGAIAGLHDFTAGNVLVDGTGGLGLCPQKNVLWDDLTVAEHVSIFNQLKATNEKDTKEQIRQLIAACDLEIKLKARSKTLSGGQKRKLQLCMMFTGGSRVCCVDEVSSGVDPLSRRKIWDILLRERGNRTIIFTTHFLDEADLLADRIAILSKGSLRAEGSAVELKHKLGGGYRVHVHHQRRIDGLGDLGITSTYAHKDQTVYCVATSAEAAKLVNWLEQNGIEDYHVAGPSVEDVFLKLADEVEEEEKLKAGEAIVDSSASSAPGYRNNVPPSRELQLLPGRRLTMLQQTWVLFRKRLTILRRNSLPYQLVLLIPIIAAALVTLVLDDAKRPTCNRAEQLWEPESGAFSSILTSNNRVNVPIGPPNRFSGDSLAALRGILPASDAQSTNSSVLSEKVQLVDSLPAFNDRISTQFANVTPGGLYLGDSGAAPTFAYKIDRSLYYSVLTQNLLNRLLTNISISTQYESFSISIPDSLGDALLGITYFGLAMAAYPAFFALYPTAERLRSVRALHYSNGVRSLSLWLAYLLFDSFFVLITSVFTVVIFAATIKAWYHVGYLFIVFLLYGIASAAFAYIISLFARSQLAAFGFCAAGQCIYFFVYFIAYMSSQTYAAPGNVDSVVRAVHFSISVISPVGSLTWALFVSLNVFFMACRGEQLHPHPGAFRLYGGPILYLLLQCLVFFGIIIWRESGPSLFSFRRTHKPADEEEKHSMEKEVADELHRVNSSSNGLRVLHLNKKFGSTTAVQDITFGVPRGEVFALLGPNGAGKSTTISMIRGELQPSDKDGEIFIENFPLRQQRAEARSHMGVCPQFDAMDRMTAIEHLRFYARIRGVADVEHNVREVERAVGLSSFSSRMAEKLSGGNKRKLSLAIALLGNPTVVLLDEPSSGMDAASKRVMWKTLASVVPNRSIVLTTHSMEEADALADRAGIMATRMLALGTTDYLRRKHGDAYYVHLITTTAPHTPPAHMERIKAWVAAHFPGAEIEEKTYHGQLRFSIPARPATSTTTSSSNTITTNTTPNNVFISTTPAPPSQRVEISLAGTLPPPPSLPAKSSISALFNLLERHKHELGLEYYSVSQTTLDQVFLSIIGQHNVEEENQRAAPPKKRWWRRFF